MISVQKSIFTCDGVKKQILSQYVFLTSYECTFHLPGVNDTYKIINDTTTYYLRIYTHKWRKLEHIASEVKLLTHLYEHKVRVSKPIMNSKGEYIIEVDAPEGKRYAVLFEAIDGADVDKLLNIEQLTSYGKSAAAIHIESDKLDKLNRFDLDMNYLIYEPLKYIKTIFPNREEDNNYLYETATKLKNTIFDLSLKEELNFGICHGDFNNGNISIDSSNNISVFDFDCFGYGWRAYDLAGFLWSRVSFNKWSETDKKIRMQSFKIFLKAYFETIPINKNEILAAFVFVPIRHIWVMGLNANNTHNTGNARMDNYYYDIHLKFFKRWIDYYGILQKETLDWDIIKKK